MRKVERGMLAALRDGVAMGEANTTVTAPDSDNVQRVFLHGHEIATYYRETGSLTRRMCGWNSNTTRSRLNALAIGFGTSGFAQRGGKVLCDGLPFCPDHDSVTVHNARPDVPNY